MRQHYIICIIAIVLGLVSCDNHEKYDTSIRVGYILCDDHSCMDIESYCKQDEKKATGVIFAEATEDHPALAVNIKEIEGQFCDSLGMSNGTSCDEEAYDGFTNTISMQHSYDKETDHGSPIAMSMLNFHANGQSNYIPSLTEMRLLIISAKAINPIIQRCGGTPIDTTGDCWYWTSTEVKEDSSIQAWLCSSVRGGKMPTKKDEAHKFRAIFQYVTSE